MRIIKISQTGILTQTKLFVDIATSKKKSLNNGVRKRLNCRATKTLLIHCAHGWLKMLRRIHETIKNYCHVLITSNGAIITAPIVFRRYANTKFSKEKTSLLTITENNNLIVKAFATAWCYREMYEECGDVDTVARKVGSTPRTIYRFLYIAYMAPDKINEVLSGKLKINVNDLFQIARENQVTIL